MLRINRENILSYFLAFVVFYFGIKEVLFPEDWTQLIPDFFGSGEEVVYLIIAHGILLILLGFFLVFRFYRRLASFVLVLMLLGIISTLISLGGLNEVAVRDIGLLGMALALSVRN